MNIARLKDIISQLLQPTKGLLAADESSKTIQKRFDKIGLISTPETNLAYRKMLFTTPGIGDYLSGVILYDETIRQEIEGMAVPRYLEDKGILPGIKVDQGVVDDLTQGLDGLRKRQAEYIKLGAKFTKWRMVVKVGEGIPSEDNLAENANRLAKYALASQDLDLVPIIEPEVLRDGFHDLKKCEQVTAWMLKTVFQAMLEQGVGLGSLILKTNMVTNGQDNPDQAPPEEVAKATVAALVESVPKEVPGIVFLSGGQTPDMATENLSAINKIGGPWELSYSFARALQDEALKIWAGKEENVPAAQKAFLDRAKKVSLAHQGKLN